MISQFPSFPWRCNFSEKLSGKISFASKAVKETRKISNYLKIYSIQLISAVLKPVDWTTQKGVIFIFSPKKGFEKGDEKKKAFCFQRRKYFDTQSVLDKIRNSNFSEKLFFSSSLGKLSLILLFGKCLLRDKEAVFGNKFMFLVFILQPSLKYALFLIVSEPLMTVFPGKLLKRKTF